MKKTIRSDKKEVSTKIVFILLFVVLVIYSLIMILSLLWGLMTSLKSTGDFEKLNNIMGRLISTRTIILTAAIRFSNSATIKRLSIILW